MIQQTAWNFVFPLISLSVLCFPAGGLAAPKHHSGVDPPYLKDCYGAKCDLRAQYCDATVGCAECSNDCHPNRIAGNKQDEQDCKTKCGWYYAWKEASSGSTRIPGGSTAIKTTQLAQQHEESTRTEVDQWWIIVVLSCALIGTLVSCLLLVVSNFTAWRLVARNYRKIDRRSTGVCQDQTSHCHPNALTELSKPQRHYSANEATSLKSLQLMPREETQTLCSSISSSRQQPGGSSDQSMSLDSSQRPLFSDTI